MSIAFAGTAPFGAAILASLADSHDVALVVSQPDRPAGRGRKMASPPVAVLARERGLDLIQPERLHDPDALEALRVRGIETIVVAAFGQLIREPLLSEFLLLNVHGSMLPAYRGAAPVERAIMDGNASTGVCIMQIEAGLDTGPVASCAEVEIAEDMTGGELYDALAHEGSRLLLDALDRAQAGTLSFTAQPQSGVSYADKITASDRAIDPRTDDARSVHDRVRALSPHIGAATWLDGERVVLWSTTRRVHDAPTPAPGAVWHDDRRLVLGAADGPVEVLEVQPGGKRRMPVGDWLRGLRTPLAHAAGGPPQS